MIKKIGCCALALGLLCSAAHRASAEPALKETPYWRKAVASGKLPPVADRVPLEPAIAKVKSIGKPGGTLQMLMAVPKDTKMMVVYGYARLVGYTPSLQLAPDILKAVDVKDGGVFTLHLRQGQKWSDGHPFTAEDFRFWFDDIAENKHLSPAGLPDALLPGGEPPRFEVLNSTTVRYSWSRPNPLFLPALAAADPLYIYAPAHYLKQFHTKYANKKKLQKMIKKKGLRNWETLFLRMSSMYKNKNPKLPTLEPWVLKTKPPSERYIFVRNPYYYRIDSDGHQLPYIDRVIFTMANEKIIPAKTGAGESDLQARYLTFDDYTFLKSAAKRNHYHVRLWRTGTGSEFALYPNLNVNDPVWRALLRKPAFRRALSLAIDRHEVNEVLYFGLAIEGQNTVLPQSPLYSRQDRSAWDKYDLARANRLLDGLGLTKRNGDGIRLLPNGQPMNIIIESPIEQADATDTLALIRDSWRDVGIGVYTRTMQLTLFRRRVFNGATLMSLDTGIDEGLATADTPPRQFAPVDQEDLEWPKWGQYFETKGMAGQPPDLPGAIRLKQLYEDWLSASTSAQRTETWEKILKIWADKVYTIGIVGGVLQPVVVNDQLRNIPKKGLYSWQPGAFFGMYKPDEFWFARPSPTANAASLTTRGAGG